MSKTNFNETPGAFKIFKFTWNVTSNFNAF